MPTLRRASAITASIFAVALLSACSGGGEPSSSEMPDAAQGTSAADTSAPDASTDAGDASGDLVAFAGWPTKIAEYTSDDTSDPAAAVYVDGNTNLVLATATSGTKMSDYVNILTAPFEVAPNATCGELAGQFLCYVEFSDKIVDFTSFKTAEEATTFVTAFLEAHGASA